MKCPNCHKEVEKGSLYCPHCLSEIPWVREFDSVETQLRKKEQQDSGGESDREGLSAAKLIYNRKRIIVICLAAAVLLGAFCYRQLHNFSALYSHASQQFEQEHYEAAARSIEAALEKKPNNESANILLAKCLEKQGKLKEGILILKPLIKNADAGVGVYEELVSLLAKNGQSAEVPVGNICAVPRLSALLREPILRFRNWSFPEITRGFIILWTVQIPLWKVLCIRSPLN